MHPQKRKRELTLAPFNPDHGHNNSIWWRAVECRRAGYTLEEARVLVDEWVTANAHLFRVGRVDPHSREIWQQVSNAYSFGPKEPQPGGDKRPRGRPAKEQPTPDAAVIAFAEECFNGYNVEELKRESSKDTTYSGAAIVADVLRRDWHYVDFICGGPSMEAMRTHPYDHNNWSCGGGTPTRDWQFIVPNPMRAETGKTLDGRQSWRCNDNACLEKDRLFFIVEFDQVFGEIVPKDSQARRLRLLSTLKGTPLRMVVDSGGKSLQGWFYVRDWSEAEKLFFWRLALSLGADPAGARLAQAFRFPNGTRRNKDGTTSKQEVVYLKY